MNRQRHTAPESLIALILAMALHSCTDDLGIRDIDLPGEYVRFTATLGDNTINATTRSTADHLEIEEEVWMANTAAQARSTRGALTTQMTGDVGVSGYDTEGTLVTGFSNNKYSFDGDALKSDEPRRWKTITSDKVTFFAYAPYQENLTASYTVPAAIKEQKDFIGATAVVEKVTNATTGDKEFNGETVKLTFEHLLAGIRFKAGFDCTVNKIEVSGVHNQGTFSFLDNKIGSPTTDNTVPNTYTITLPDDKKVKKAGDFITLNDTILMMIPQTLPSGATVKFYYNGNATPITADISTKVWAEGKLITYTIYKEKPNYVYLDLAAGDITIDNNTYTGYRFIADGDGGFKADLVTGGHNDANIYYVYQSTEDNRSTTGIIEGKFVRPPYPAVEGPYGGSWADYITNNQSVEDVIEMWDNETNVTGTTAKTETAERQNYAMVRKANRTHTTNYITVTGSGKYKLTIDNIYSSYQETSTSRTTGGITYTSTGSGKLTINSVGDNRIGCVHKDNSPNSEVIFEGTGSLTIADVDFYAVKTSDKSTVIGIIDTMGYYSNHWNAAIGNNDGQNDCFGIVINSGVIFAGTTKAENCSAIGGGGNGEGEVTINGGVVTAVATTTGTAIGGGIGFTSVGGIGTVKITGGNVYAYNHANRWNIPSSAIGGGGTKESTVNPGTTIDISGGNIYAESGLGTAIGGGSSYRKQGGEATITITGGKIIAKSNAENPRSPGIGGGCSITEGSTESTLNGGDAIIKISGNPIIRTGSIGGGSTGAKLGKKGTAQITIHGGDIQAQFVMEESNPNNPPKFTMYDGTIRNSNTVDPEYKHTATNGGAVFMKNGIFKMEGGTIKNCSAEQGGAVYITDPNTEDDNKPKIIMSGGSIIDCTSKTDGGAIYLAGGEATVSGDATIQKNIAQSGNGGGICIEQGNFTMNGGIVKENSAFSKSDNTGGNGGGVYVSSTQTGVVVNLLSGYIQANTTDRNGGGVHIDMPSGSATITVGNDNGEETTGPDISYNHTILQGGGLYAYGAGANIIINGGSITSNTVSGYVDNPNVANEQGMVTLNNKDVTNSIVVTFDGNKGNVDADPTEGVDWQETTTQYIVTNTNSMLRYPDVSRAGWTFVGWNARADGLGEWYWKEEWIDDPNSVNYKPLYRNTNLTLYAQWEL